MSSTVADLYDPADVAFKPGDAGPCPMCAGCGQIEVGAYEPVCPECRKSLEHAGILKPQDQRQQIGPLAAMLRKEIDTLRAQLAEVEKQRDYAIHQAQIWKLEAASQKATVAECYQICTDATGEPGDWDGAEPVRALKAQLAEAQKDEQRLDWLEAQVNKNGELHLHDGNHSRGIGIGLRPGTLVRTLRAAIDAANGEQ